MKFSLPTVLLCTLLTAACQTKTPTIDLQRNYILEEFFKEHAVLVQPKSGLSLCAGIKPKGDPVFTTCCLLEEKTQTTLEEGKTLADKRLLELQNFWKDKIQKIKEGLRKIPPKTDKEIEHVIEFKIFFEDEAGKPYQRPYLAEMYFCQNVLFFYQTEPETQKPTICKAIDYTASQKSEQAPEAPQQQETISGNESLSTHPEKSKEEKEDITNTSVGNTT